MSNQENLQKLIGKRYNWDTAQYDVKKVEPKKKTLTKEDKKAKLEDDKKMLETEKEYKEALAYIKDLVSPAFMKIKPNNIKINNTFAKTFFVYAYPSFLEWNWLSPIINWDVKFDMSLFVYPVDSAYIQKFLRKRLTQLNSERSMNAEKGLVNDPAINAQIQDVE